ncbi:MAG: SGNH/GDSL hydrolase family protein [Bradyrhizobium sp.]|nr:SGNH/GDSL hydrolase family protein [Bradyrhizobium sp.]
MAFLSCQRCSQALAASAVLAGVLSASIGAAQAQVTVHAALSTAAPTQAARTQASPQPSSPAASSETPLPANSAAYDPSLPPPKTLAAAAIDKVKQAAKSATDIFSRVPCVPPKGGAQSLGSLPHVAGRLIAGQPVTIIAFGSSSTQGYGSSAPEFTYPNRLAAQLKRQYPAANISVINAGIGGEDAPEMMKRLQTSVIDVHPDLVIWQVGTNAVLRNLDPAETAKIVEDGVARIQAAGSDVVLVDPQYSPRVYERADSASRMVRMLSRVAALRHVGIFPRFEVMREWHENQSLPVDSFVIADGLHMNDWGYACFAQLLGDDIIKSVGQIKIGVNLPAEVRTYRPM